MNVDAIFVPDIVSISIGLCGSAKRSRPRSFSGLIDTIVAPRFAHSRSSPIIRGWLVAGFWPKISSVSACSKSSSVTVPLPTPTDVGSPRLVASWHMFEQSGKLFVPYRRTSSWYRNAASLLARPDV